jgi:hypothetical protein
MTIPAGCVSHTRCFSIGRKITCGAGVSPALAAGTAAPQPWQPGRLHHKTATLFNQITARCSADCVRGNPSVHGECNTDKPPRHSAVREPERPGPPPHVADAAGSSRAITCTASIRGRPRRLPRGNLLPVGNFRWGRHSHGNVDADSRWSSPTRQPSAKQKSCVSCPTIPSCSNLGLEFCG